MLADRCHPRCRWRHMTARPAHAHGAAQDGAPRDVAPPPTLSHATPSRCTCATLAPLASHQPASPPPRRLTRRRAHGGFPSEEVCAHVFPLTVWPSGLRRWLQAPVRKGVGSNPTAVTCIVKPATAASSAHRTDASWRCRPCFPARHTFETRPIHARRARESTRHS